MKYHATIDGVRHEVCGKRERAAIAIADAAFWGPDEWGEEEIRSRIGMKITVSGYFPNHEYIGNNYSVCEIVADEEIIARAIAIYRDMLRGVTGEFGFGDCQELGD